MGSFSVEVRGKDKLITKFENMSGDLKREVAKSVKKNTYEMEGRAKKNAPYLTGHLKRNIRSQIYNGGLSGEVTSHAKYSIYQELGTRYMSAQPFMFPAFIVTRSAFMRDLNRIFKDVVK